MPSATGSEKLWNRHSDRGLNLLWDSLLSLLLLWSTLSVLAAQWGTLAPAALWPVTAAIAAWALWQAAESVRVGWLLRVLPWPVLLALWGREALQGLLLWFNCVLTAWNQLHRDGLTLFQAEATAQSVLAVSILAAFAVGQAVSWAVTRRRLLACGAAGLCLLLLQLLTGGLHPLACGLWMSGFLGLWTSGNRQAPARQSLRLWAAGTAALCFCAVLSGGELSELTRLRHTAAEELHTLRYGEDPLPQGSLADAGRLNESDAAVLEVRTEQEKTLYLRAYVGAELSENVWSPLPGEAYGGDYAGMLDWLAEQDFDPLTQPALYYALSGEEAPEPQQLQVDVTGGARCYLYAPITAERVDGAHYGERQDQRMTARGPLGARFYTVTERSSTRPAELTVRADWVTAPETEAQARYAEAEAVYRAFVYDSYTKTDSALEPLLEPMFWQDYDAESDSIYSALERVRDVLKRETSYVRTPETAAESAEPLRDFLLGKIAGNAVLYASAAVEALRSYGIPTRYVEGYYLSAADSRMGQAMLTGQNAHAWAEVYFDGIGWLPVDVTPGYYYDSVTLREMVALPDTPRKTAALADSSEGEDVSTVEEPAVRPVPETAELLRDTALVLLGLAALVILVLTVLYLLLAGFWLALSLWAKRRYRRSTPLEQAGMLYRWSLRLLWAWDIDACLGWSTEETDAAVAKQFPEIGPGAYTRAAVLMERVLYGGMAPEPYELRALQTFLDKLARHRPQELRRRMRRIITGELWKKLHRPAGKAGAA